MSGDAAALCDYNKVISGIKVRGSIKTNACLDTT